MPTQTQVNTPEQAVDDGTFGTVVMRMCVGGCWLPPNIHTCKESSVSPVRGAKCATSGHAKLLTVRPRRCLQRANARHCPLLTG